MAVWAQDWDVQALSLNSLGNLKIHQGELSRAKTLLKSALRVAERQRLDERRAKVFHDLYAVAFYSGEFAEAEEYARRAFTSYGPDHPDLANLAFDVAHLWLQHGYFARTLQVLRALLPHFDDPDRRVRVLSSAARAAGALKQAEAFDAFWSGAWSILDRENAEKVRAAAGLELGLGALNLSRWADAGHALERAREAAEKHDEPETLARIDAAIAILRAHERADAVVRPGPGSRTPRTGDVLALELSGSLERQAKVALDS